MVIFEVGSASWRWGRGRLASRELVEGECVDRVRMLSLVRLMTRPPFWRVRPQGELERSRNRQKLL
jgi:hypothetical protein